jgi:Protein of unknown function (DUF4038)/Putative collagen-binding domain of a collagenase
MFNLSPARTRAISLLALLALLKSVVTLADQERVKPISVSPDGHFLMKPDGTPFFWLSDFAEELVTRTTREEADLYLRDRARKGYTLILTGVLAYFDKDKANLSNRVRNLYGAAPFANADFSHPNPEYFSYLDWLVERAEHYGLRVALVPTWGLFSLVDGRLTKDNARTYGKWLGLRYRDRGIVWVLGGDIIPLWSKRGDLGGGYVGPNDAPVVDYRPIFDSLAAGITEGEGDRPLITYHIACCSWLETAPPRTSLYFYNRSWLSVNYVQETSFANPGAIRKLTGFGYIWSEGYEYEPIRAEYESNPTRPVIAADPNADGSTIDSAFDDHPENDNVNDVRGRFGPGHSRYYAYESVFSGAAGCGYFNNAISQFYDPGRNLPLMAPNSTWRRALDSPGALQVAYVKALMLSRPYFTRIPDQTIIVGEVGEGHAHRVATRDRQGAYLMVYLPQGQPVTVALNRLSGTTATAWWFDPRSGRSTRVQRTFDTKDSQTFTPPTDGGPGADWVLVLDDASKGYGAPATVQQ